MRSFLKKIFIDNWPRKLVSFILAIITWIIVNQSMTITKTYHNVPIKIINVPQGKTIEGLQDNNFLTKKLSITVTGNKNSLDELSETDIEIILDAKGKSDDWIVTLTPKNLHSLNPDINISKSVNKVVHPNFILKLTDLTTEKIPVHITQPIGEAPKGYLYLDVWPYQLYVTVKGPQEIIKQLKSKGLKITYNLNNVTQQDLEKIHLSEQKDELSYIIPEDWKTISLPILSSTPITIDDPAAKSMRIDFAKKALLPIDRSLPISLFFPLKTSITLNPDTYTLATNDFIQKINGIKMVSQPLFANGVSRLFLEVVKDMIQLVVTVQNSKESPSWNVQFISPHQLEDCYVAKVMSENDISDFQPHLREEYLRNRFRNYMNKFRIYTSDNKKLSLDITLDANTIQILPKQ